MRNLYLTQDLIVVQEEEGLNFDIREYTKEDLVQYSVFSYDYVKALMDLHQTKLLKELRSNGPKKNGEPWRSVDRMFRQANVTSAKEVLKFYQNQEEEIYCVLRACTPSEFMDRFHNSLADDLHWMCSKEFL